MSPFSAAVSASPARLRVTADVAEVLFGVTDSELVIEGGNEFLNRRHIVLHQPAAFVRNTHSSPTEELIPVPETAAPSFD